MAAIGIEDVLWQEAERDSSLLGLIADLLEEEGREMELAAAIRWAMTNNKFPAHELNVWFWATKISGELRTAMMKFDYHQCQQWDLRAAFERLAFALKKLREGDNAA